jgi:hypothetical protein
VAAGSSPTIHPSTSTKVKTPLLRIMSAFIFIFSLILSRFYADFINDRLDRHIIFAEVTVSR